MKNNLIRHYFSVNVDDAAAVSASMRPTVERLRALGEKIPDYVTDDHVFVHIVATSEIYNHPWYGIVNYTYDDLKEMADNHSNKAIRQDMFLRKGHISWSDDGGAPANGWYCTHPEVTRVEKIGNVDGVDIFALFLTGYYNSTGFESIRGRDEFRYTSSEINHYFEEREITTEVVELLKKRIVSESDDTDDDKEVSHGGVKGREYGTVCTAIALTNHPFFHLPNIQNDSKPESIDPKTSTFALSNGQLYASFGGVNYSMQKISKELPELNDKLMEAMKTNGLSIYSTSSIGSFAVKNSLVNTEHIDVVDVSTEIVQDEAGENKNPRTDVGSKFAIQESEMNFYSMTIDQLAKLDVSAFSEAEKAAYEFTVAAKQAEAKFASAIADEKQRTEQVKAQFTKQLADKDSALEMALAEAAKTSNSNYSLRVEQLKERANAIGIPTAVVSYAVDTLSDLDPSARRAEFKFANPATNRDESLDLVTIVDRLFASFKTEMFAGRSEPVTEVKVVPNPEETTPAKSGFSSIQEAMRKHNIPR